MAGRRCFSEKIVESDAFHKLPENAQALYFHLNMVADDDGFINNASNVASRIKSGKVALRKLVESRFLLQFSDIFVVKHWRISNSLKNDRLKPLAYASVAAKIWVKPNRSYTDHPVSGCRTLYEMKTGVAPGDNLESSWNPVGILTEPNRREPKRREPNRTEMDGCFSELWNDYPELRRGSMQNAKAAFASTIQTVEDCELAIANLAQWKKSEQWVKDGGQYVPYLCNWIERGTWKSFPPGKASQICGASGELDEVDMAAIRRILSESDDA